MRASAPNDMSTIEQVIEYIASDHCKALGGPGEYMSYSNDGYAILCSIFDKAAGVPLEQFLTERVFHPMGMFRTVLDEDCSEAHKLASDGNITRLWGRDEDGKLQIDDNWGILPPFRACACVKSTAHDFARYYQCLSNHGVIDGVQAIPAAAADMMCGPQFPLGENYSYVAFCNEGDQDTDDLCWMMGNMLMGRPLDEEQVWLHPTGEQFSQPEMLEGTYACHEGIPVEFKVFVEDGKLKVQRPLGIYDLVHCGETWFQVFNKKGQRCGRCHFWVRDGKAWGVQVYTRVYQRAE